MEMISKGNIHGSRGRLSIGAGYQRFYCTHQCCFESLLWFTKFTEDPWDIWSELMAPLVRASTLSLCCAGHYRFPLHQYFYNLYITVYLIMYCISSLSYFVYYYSTQAIDPWRIKKSSHLKQITQLFDYLFNQNTEVNIITVCVGQPGQYCTLYCSIDFSVNHFKYQTGFHSFGVELYLSQCYKNIIMYSNVLRCRMFLLM